MKNILFAQRSRTEPVRTSVAFLQIALETNKVKLLGGTFTHIFGKIDLFVTVTIFSNSLKWSSLQKE